QTRFLHLAQQRECFIKMPVTDNISEEEVHQALHNITSVTTTVPLVLQPVTPGVGGCRPPDAQTLLQWQAAASKYVDDVRIIPQCHPLIGMR
ncbi:MAG: 7-carboxy-7-deazaguanine synthase QueE, partial [Armatimonadetes bacterium]|nr:7-carboxy-7-deazaguanine synthase QueE [Armatimonadota bacterium]